MELSLTNRLRAKALELGAADIGFVSAQVLTMSREALVERKAAGYASSMQFTYRNPDRSSDPFQLLPSAKSIVAITYPYAASSDRTYDELNQIHGLGAVARFGRHNHYSDLRDCLAGLVAELKSEGFKAVGSADTNALVDREVAWRAGLGWYGKNSQILTSANGSWVLLGAVVTNAELVEQEPIPLESECGSCTRCIDLCPTDAIVADGVIDARRCIAWLVQAPDPIPVEFRSAVGTRLYGCDECADVCPPSATALSSLNPEIESKGIDSYELSWVLRATDAEILANVDSWYIPKRNPDFIRRTALVCLGNSPGVDLSEARGLLSPYLVSENEMLVEHAQWAAEQLGLEELIDA